MRKALSVVRVATLETLAIRVDRVRQVMVEELQKAVRELASDGVDPQCDTVDEKQPVPGVLWVIPSPPAVRAAFDSALDLYRLVEGSEASATSFIEALLARLT